MALPPEIVATAPKGMEWGIELAGKGQYRFKLSKLMRIVPRPDLIAVKIPDATPEIISAYALTHEQSLLAKVRYNRLIDVFLGIASYSLQNHLQTFVKDIGQIEIDEVYVGVNRHGQQYVVPVQAKGGADQLGVTQTRQDIACCVQKFPRLTCRIDGRSYGPRNEGSPVQNHGCDPLARQHDHRTFPGKAALGGGYQGLPQALARGGKARFRLAGQKSGRLRGRLFLARQPLQIPAAHQHRILAQQDRNQQAA
jgi:hypothetical protein